MNLPEQGQEVATALPPAPTPDLEIRELSSLDELHACVRLQREVWGADFTEVVPASLLKVNREVEGVTAGALAPDGELVGFVYGLTGIRAGRPSHWSHMLGVRASHRGMGIGFRLKQFQRDYLLARGVEEMRWTFDPLVAGNAHFNLNLLGAGVETYLVDAYGDTGSGIHSLGTDRFVARWWLPRGAEGSHGPRGASVDWSLAATLPASGGWPNGNGWPQAVRIAVPGDILDLKRRAPEEAGAWRRSTRDAFQSALRAGYRVVGFSRPAGSSVGHYLLVGPAGPEGKAPR